MQLDAYQQAARKTAIYDERHARMWDSPHLMIKFPRNAMGWRCAVGNSAHSCAILLTSATLYRRSFNMKVPENMSATAVRVSVLLSADDAQRFDSYCHDRGFKKSTLIARLIREHLDRERYPSQRSLFPDQGGRA